jgi:hypothetical protein
MPMRLKWVQRHRSKLRRYLVEAQGGLCAYCFEPMQPPFPQCDDAATLDHVFPRRSGGKDGTCVAVHFRCNTKKGHRHPSGCELLALDWVRTKVYASARLRLLIGQVLETLGKVPAWAQGGQLRYCDCRQCRELDARFPKEGRQLLLPMTGRD